MPVTGHFISRAAFMARPLIVIFRMPNPENKRPEPYMPSGRMDVLRTLRMIKEHQREQRPLSLIRLGDGEGRVAGFPDIIDRQELNVSLRRWFGTTHFDTSELLELAQDLRCAIRAADIVGIPTLRQQKWPAYQNLIHALRRYKLIRPGQTMVDSAIHRYLNFGLFYRFILRDLDFCGLITCRDVADRLRRLFSIGHVQVYRVRAEPRFPVSCNEHQALHFPQRYKELRHALTVPYPGALFLVGACALGKIYCHWIRQAGGIALDVGSMFDAWVNVESRKFISQPFHNLCDYEEQADITLSAAIARFASALEFYGIQAVGPALTGTELEDLEKACAAPLAFSASRQASASVTLAETQQEYQPLCDSGPNPDAPVLQGKDGFLFLLKDANRVLDQQTGRLLISDEDLLTWENTYHQRRDYCRQKGIELFVVLSPDKYRVYEHKLPDSIALNDIWPGAQFSSLLGSILGSHYIDPTEVLRKAARTSLVFHKSDTHWDARGAYLAYCLLVDAMGRKLNVKKLGPPAYRIRHVSGNLGSRFQPEKKLAYSSAEFQRSARLVYDNGVLNTGRIKIYVNDRVELPVCLAFGSSSMINLLIYLAESFRKLVFVWDQAFDYELISAIRPDVVISQASERYVIRPVQDDAPGLTAMDIAIVDACLPGPDDVELRTLRQHVNYVRLSQAPCRLLPALCHRVMEYEGVHDRHIACLAQALRNNAHEALAARLLQAKGMGESTLRSLAGPELERKRKERAFSIMQSSELFDEQFYLQANPDVAASQMEAAFHYDKHGWKEFRNPSAAFNTRYYLEHNPDVRRANRNPLIHYLLEGRAQGRSPMPPKLGQSTQASGVRGDRTAGPAGPDAERRNGGRGG